MDVDVLWRLEHRSGMACVCRSGFWQPLYEGAATDYLVLAAAQRQALRRVAEGIAAHFDYDVARHAPATPW